MLIRRDGSRVPSWRDGDEKSHNSLQKQQQKNSMFLFLWIILKSRLRFIFYWVAQMKAPRLFPPWFLPGFEFAAVSAFSVNWCSLTTSLQKIINSWSILSAEEGTDICILSCLTFKRTFEKRGGGNKRARRINPSHRGFGHGGLTVSVLNLWILSACVPWDLN